MNTTYIPQTSIFEKRDLMYEWEETNKYGAISGFVLAAAAFFIGYLCSDFGDFFEFSLYAVTVAQCIGGHFMLKWKLPSYWVKTAAFLYFVVIWLIGFSRMDRNALIMSAFALASGAVTCFFTLKAIYNYNTVFKELEKCKGFPSFIANSADLYGDKIYLKDEKNDESRKYQAAHNPFNTQEEIKKEEFVRSQNLKAENRQSQTLNIGEGETSQIQNYAKTTPQPQVKKKGLSILGLEIIFSHGNIPESSFEEKKELMYKWNSNVEAATGHIVIPLFLMCLGIVFSFIGASSIIPVIMGIGSVLLLILGTNNMKMGNLRGAFEALIAVVMYAALALVVGAGGNGIPMVFVFVTSLVNIIIVLPTLRYIINYHIYSELSTQEGFPSFIRTYSQKYAKDMYILEEQQPIAKQQKITREGMIVMDVGYDEKPKEDEGAWNAFDYMDKEKTNDENGDNNEDNG